MEADKTKKTGPKTKIKSNEDKLKQEKKRREEAKERAPLLIRFEFATDTYEEVLEVRAYEYINLFAEMGGYIGLFTGWAVLQGLLTCMEWVVCICQCCSKPRK